MNNPWKIIALVFIVLFAATALISISGISFSDAARSPPLSGSAKNSTVSAEIATNYIQTNLVGSAATVRLVEVTEESGLYRLSLNIRSADKPEETLYVFMSKDGKYLFPSTFMINQYIPLPKSTIPPVSSASPANACNLVTKTESPTLEAFVVSHCPYGTQMQAILVDIITRIPSLSQNIKVRYIGDVSQGTIVSMHGPAEAAENLKQICIREEQADKYWEYISCTLSSKSSGTCIQKAGVDNTTLTRCINDNSRGIAYAQEDFSLSRNFGVTASPTLILNNMTVREFDFGGRTPEAIKSLLCCGFATQPEGCKISLGNSQVPAGSAGQC